FSLVMALAPVGASNITAGDINGDGTVTQSELASVLAHLGPGAVDQPNLNLALYNYFTTADPFLLTNVAGLGGSNVSFGVSNSPESIFNVQYSTNPPGGWQTLGPALLDYHFTDTNAPAAPQRYYRLIFP